MANPIVQQINIELENLQKELSQFRTTVAYLSEAKDNVSNAVDSVKKAETLFEKKTMDLKSTLDGLKFLNESVLKFTTTIDQIDFPKRLDSIESGFTELLEIQAAIKDEIEKSIKQLDQQIEKVDFNKKFFEIQKEVSKAVGSNDKVISDIKKLDIPGSLLHFETSLSKKVDESNQNIKRLITDSVVDLLKNTKQIATETSKSILDLNLPIRMDKLDANISGILTSIQNVQGRTESVERNLGEKLKDSSERLTAGINNLSEKNNQLIHRINEEIERHHKGQQMNTYITWGIISLGVALIIFFCKQP